MMLWQQLRADITKSQSLISLPHFSLLRVAGLEAADFLNRQLTQDILILPLGQAVWSAYCSAKGRVMACFWVLKATDELFYLMVPNDQLAWLQKRLMMFVLRAKVKVEIAQDMVLLGGWQHLAELISITENSLIFNLPNLNVSADLEPIIEGRFVVITPKAELDHTKLNQDQQAQIHPGLTWIVADWRYGLSWIDEHNREQCTPHDISLDRVHGVSFKKGCYPGQEVVARMHYLGRAKQRLSLWIGAGKAFLPIKTGVDVFLPDLDQPVGTVVNCWFVSIEQVQYTCLSLSTSGFIQWQVGQTQSFKWVDELAVDFECVAILD